MLDPTVLLASSDRSLVESMGGILSTMERLRLEVASGIDQACDRVGRDDVLLVLAHLGEESPVAGITRLLQTIAITNPSAKLLVLSDRYHAEQALALLRLGVADYLARPLDLSRLTYLVDVLTLEARYTGRRPEPRAEPVELAQENGSFIDLPTTKMGRLMQQIRRIAAQSTTILLDGETGTGKARLASQIHQLSSNASRPFLAINCGALSASLIESEMFGHVKGPSPGPTATASASSPRSARGPSSSTRSTRSPLLARPSWRRADGSGWPAASCRPPVSPSRRIVVLWAAIRRNLLHQPPHLGRGQVDERTVFLPELDRLGSRLGASAGVAGLQRQHVDEVGQPSQVQGPSQVVGHPQPQQRQRALLGVVAIAEHQQPRRGIRDRDRLRQASDPRDEGSPRPGGPEPAARRHAPPGPGLVDSESDFEPQPLHRREDATHQFARHRAIGTGQQHRWIEHGRTPSCSC